MYTLVLSEKGGCEVAWCTANKTFYLDNKTTPPYAVHNRDLFRRAQMSAFCLRF